jgi:hypothetical protein
MRLEYGKVRDPQSGTRARSVLLGLGEAIGISVLIGLIHILESGNALGAIVIDWLLLTLGVVAFLVPGQWPTGVGMTREQLKSGPPRVAG